MTTTETSTGGGWRVDDSTFGARLALVRQRMDWNIKQAARECGLPGASWRTWERDGVEPRRLLEIATIIAKRTGCDYGWLLAGPRLGARDHEVNNWYPRAADRTRPNGHPGHAHPDPLIRRPSRVRPALAAV